MFDSISYRKIITILLIMISLLTMQSFASFIENKGQFPSNILFFAKANDCNIWIKDNKIVFDYFDINPTERIISGNAISIEFNNSNAMSNFSAIATNNTKYNYFSKNMQITDVSSFDTLIFRNKYNNIDIRLYFSDGYFCYDFIVHTGGHPNSISMNIKGAKKVYSAKEKLIVQIDDNKKIYHDRLFAYCNESKSQVQCSFEVNDNNRVGFNIDNNYQGNSITIDPIVFSTFYGGNNFDYARALAADKFGNAIIVGNTLSKNFPTTIGSYDTVYTENDWDFREAFVSKFDSTGQNLLFSTFLGGIGDDFAECIALDDNGNIYLSGYTISLHSFPVTSGSIDSLDRGGFDVFFSKLNPNGNQLLHSTLIGGSSDDFGLSIALDKFGNVYLTGYTNSLQAGLQRPYPTTPTAYDTTVNGNYDVFVTKLNSNNYSIVYSTFVGGSQADFGQSIIVDSIGNAVVGGITRSTNFPTTPFAYSRVFGDSVITGLSSDGFIFKLNSTGSSMIFSTFLGGKGRDGVYAICLDKYSNIYASGLTESANFPVRTNAFDLSYNNLMTGGVFGDVFISNLTSDGSVLINSTFFGGRGTERANAIAIDNEGHIYITGSTNSVDFPTTRRAFQTTYKDTNLRTDAFAAKFSSELNQLLYSTYIGGSTNDVGNGIAPINNTFFVTGWTESIDFPTFGSAYSNSPNDTSKANVFLLRIAPNLIDIDLFGDEYSDRFKNICIGDSIFVGGTASGGFGDISYSWAPRVGVSNPDSSHSYFYPKRNTEYVITVADSKGNIARDTMFITVLQKPTPVIFGPKLVLRSSEIEYFVGSNQTSQFNWTATNGAILSGQGTERIKVKWLDSIASGSLKVVLTNSADCSDSASINITISYFLEPQIVFSSEASFCEGDSVVLSVKDDYYFYLWSTGEKTKSIVVNQTGNYFVFVSDSTGFGGTSDTLKLRFVPAPNPTIYGLFAVKPNLTYSYITDYFEDYSYNWIVANGQIISGQGTDSVVVRWDNAPNASIAVEVVTKEGCSGLSDLMMLDVGGIFKPKIRILGSRNICEGDSVLLDAGFGYNIYQWNNGKTTRFISVATADSFFCFVRDAYGFSGWTDTVVTAILPRPPKPEVEQFGNQLICLSDSLPLQWYFNDQAIPNATNSQYIADIPGIYKVCVRGINGCRSCSDLIYYLVSTEEYSNEKINSIHIFPNPFRDAISILVSRIEDIAEPVSISIYDALGRKVLDNTYNSLYNNELIRLNVSFLPSGLFLLSFEHRGNKTIKTIIKH